MSNRVLLMVAAAVAIVFGAGCEEEYDGPVVPNIAGNWRGSYYFYEQDDKGAIDLSKGSRRGLRAITATVVQNEDNHMYVSITTSKSGRGHHFYGTIDGMGNMRMVDSYDGETWTTFNRRATPQVIELNDLVLSGEIKDDVGQGLMTVLLNQRVTERREEESSYFN